MSIEEMTKGWGKPLDVDPNSVPVVFHFRPTAFFPVPRSKLAQWEEAMKTHVGLTPPLRLDDYPWTGDPRETISGSVGGDWGGFDDCDCS
jgi:hypothetical protein